MKIHFLTVLALLFLSISSVETAANAMGQAQTTRTFCDTVQIDIMKTTVDAETVVHPDWQAFLKSKASVDPLRNEQFVTTDPNGQPRLVSCKMKTPDHIREVFGESAANEKARSCEAINRETVAAVLTALTPEEQVRQVITDDQIVFEEDLTEFMGVNWVKPFDYVFEGTEGTLHIRSKRLQVDWTNLLFKLAPEQFRGALYCHLIAPEYVKALLLGEADAALIWSAEVEQP